eukprot:85732-Chlamydomonas_euryale.AAC.1
MFWDYELSATSELQDVTGQNARPDKHTKMTPSCKVDYMQGGLHQHVCVDLVQKRSLSLPGSIPCASAKRARCPPGRI